MDRFGRIVVQICNLNPEVALHSMFLALRPSKFASSLCKKKKTLIAWMSCANEPKATSRWRRCPSSGIRSNKPNKSATSKIDSHKLNKRHKPDKHQPFPKGFKYEHYTPLIVNHTTILRRVSTSRGATTLRHMVTFFQINYLKPHFWLIISNY